MTFLLNTLLLSWTILIIPIMQDIDHPTFIEEQKQNLDAAAYEKNQNQEVKIPSIRLKLYRDNKTEYWPKIIK